MILDFVKRRFSDDNLEKMESEHIRKLNSKKLRSTLEVSNGYKKNLLIDSKNKSSHSVKKKRKTLAIGIPN